MTDKSEEEHPYLYPTWPKPYLYPPYPIKGMSEVTDCEHKHAQFQGMYSLVGHYHCPVCKSRFCPQEFQKYLEGVDKCGVFGLKLLAKSLVQTVKKPIE